MRSARPAAQLKTVPDAFTTQSVPSRETAML